MTLYSLNSKFLEYYCNRCKMLVGFQYYETTIAEYGCHVLNYECFDALKYMPDIYDELKTWILNNTTSDFIISNIIKIDNEKIIKEIIE